MKRNLVLVVCSITAAALPVAAQDPGCAQTGPEVSNVCSGAADLFRYMTPQLAGLIAAGNTTLGEAGTIGGWGKFAVSIRGNILAASIPQMENLNPVAPNDRSPRQIPVVDRFLRMPALDGVVGVFNGWPLGVTRVGGVDLLASAFYLPEYEADGLGLKLRDGSLKLGWGARVGIVQEAQAIPAVGFSWAKRELPRAHLSARGTAGGFYRYEVNDLRINTSSWRLTASKSSSTIFGLAAGLGQDRYDSRGEPTGVLGSGTTGPPRMRQRLTRNTYFADLTIRTPVGKLVAEAGMVRGGDVDTYNTFIGKSANAARFYSSFGFGMVF